MPVHVELPIGELIEFRELARSIALARLKKEGLTGLECITGKVVVVRPIPRAEPDQMTLTTTDKASDQVEFGQHRARYIDTNPWLFRSDRPSGLFVIDEHSNARDLYAEAAGNQSPMILSYRLADEDKRLLARLLPDLPKLQAPLTHEAREAFLNAYRTHPGRAPWEPELLPAYSLDVEKGRLEELSVRCQQELSDDFSEQRFSAFNFDRSRAKWLVAGTFVPRQMALDYLKQWHDMVLASGRLGETVSAQIVAPATAQSNARGSIPENVSSQDREPSKVNARQKSVDPADVYEYRKQLGKKRVKAPTVRTAEHFGISASLVRRKIRQYKEKRLQLASPFPGSGQ